MYSNQMYPIPYNWRDSGDAGRAEFSPYPQNPAWQMPVYCPDPAYAQGSVYEPAFRPAVMKRNDYGPAPIAFNIEEVTKRNNAYRRALWTGSHLQLTLMSIPVGGDIGLEAHPHLDQFIRIEEGQGLVMMGDRQDQLTFQRPVSDDFAFIIPAGKWHNLINTGNRPIKLYSIYAPPQHPHGTVHETKADAMAAEH
ncbi:cupin domain-containing protein [Sporolactobacillus terrae]|uniref:cupin domain-containing protein n=1 Tax=Sporolactobacillus terrae TaxID=269673 RepID=UPI00048A69E0|nr:cupin domain-containing protein [Sporolactobacillus terrae]